MIAVVVAVSLVLAPPVEGDDVSTPTQGPSEDVRVDDVLEQQVPVDEAPVDEASAEPTTDTSPPRPTPTPDERVVEPHRGVVGGYWDMDRTRGAEPKDGHEEIIAGSILVPLGLIAVSSSAATIWLSAPGQCEARWGSVGASPTADQCRGLRTFGIIRVSYGSLMAITGAVLLGIGLTRREKHRKWERGSGARLGAWLGGRGGGVVWTGRFGLGRG